MLELTAYELKPDTGFQLVPGPRTQPWMAETPYQSARRCLPMLIANQAGWLLLNNRSVRVLWNGGDDPRGSIMIQPVDERAAARVVTFAQGGTIVEDPVRAEALPRPATRLEYPLKARSTFGYGIVTWEPPLLFRTSPGYNLLVRGPANCPKDGVTALEGIVETDWCPATFTVNWKITCPNTWIEFAAGEPLAMLVPQRRGELEEFEPEIRALETNPELSEAYGAWRDVRLAQKRGDGPDECRLDYMRGSMPDGTAGDQHQTRLTLRSFT
jgi:hypothetical protein